MVSITDLWLVENFNIKLQLEKRRVPPHADPAHSSCPAHIRTQDKVGNDLANSSSQHALELSRPIVENSVLMTFGRVDLRDELSCPSFNNIENINSGEIGKTPVLLVDGLGNLRDVGGDGRAISLRKIDDVLEEDHTISSSSIPHVANAIEILRHGGVDVVVP